MAIEHCHRRSNAGHPVYLSACLCDCLSVYVCPCVRLFVRLIFFLFVSLSNQISVSKAICPFVYLLSQLWTDYVLIVKKLISLNYLQVVTFHLKECSYFIKSALQNTCVPKCENNSHTLQIIPSSLLPLPPNTYPTFWHITVDRPGGASFISLAARSTRPCLLDMSQSGQTCRLNTCTIVHW